MSTNYGCYEPSKEVKKLIDEFNKDLKEYAPIPCKNFDDGCSVWCCKGDLDCCILCCRRHTCDDVCPKAKKILSLPEFRDKHYSWE